MNTSIEALSKKQKRTKCDWHHDMPWNITDNSAFIYKVAKACMGREFIFKSGLIEEMPTLKRATRISQFSAIVQLQVLCTQPRTEELLYREVLEQVQFITLCSHVPHDNKVLINIIHSMSRNQIIKHVLRRPSSFMATLRYGYRVMELGGFFPRVDIHGSANLCDLSWGNGAVVPKVQQIFVEKTSRLLIDPGTYVARRLS